MDKALKQLSPEAQEPAEGVPQFYIPAKSSILEYWPRTLKHGDTFAMFDRHGDVVNAQFSPLGIFHEDTRYLSGLEVTIGGHRPLLLSSTLQDDNAVLTVDLANPDIYRDEQLMLLRETLHILRTKFLWQGACYERLAVHNFDAGPQHIRLGISFTADFADLFEVRGIKRARRGVYRVERRPPDTVVFHYAGLDGIERCTHVRFEPPPTVLSDNNVYYDLTLAPGERWPAFMTIHCADTSEKPRLHFATNFRTARRALRQSASHMAVVNSTNAMFNQVLCRSVADLQMLITDTPQGPYPYAGIPWFSTPFGRDGIITALEMLWLDPGVAKGVLKFLAATQAREVDEQADAEPGKIMHEMRRGEMARLKEIPFGLYYGSVDATPLFAMLAGRYFERTGDIETIKSVWPNIEAALTWMDTYGDPDGDGFVEYQSHSPQGLRNQGWKDSRDAVPHADGTLAQGPIALCEVQGYVYAAKQAAAEICRALGKHTAAEKFRHEAEAMRERFEATFWCEEIGTYALALDGGKRQCKVRTSNPGHALYAGIVSPERARRVADTLFGRESFSGWGIRTMGAGERRYNPMAYHNGSVWPHDNAIIALGLARYGFKREAARIFSALFEATRYMDLQRLPELFCGFSRREGNGPTLYPVACMPQAWASAAPLALLEACLGMHCDYINSEVRFDQPVLPRFVEELRILDLQVGNAEIDLLLRRHANDVAVNILDRRGTARVTVVN